MLGPKDSAVSIQNICTTSAHIDAEELPANRMATGKQREYASIGRFGLIDNYISDPNLRSMGRDKFSLSGFDGFFGGFGGNTSGIVGPQQKITLTSGNNRQDSRQDGEPPSIIRNSFIASRFGALAFGALAGVTFWIVMLSWLR